MVKNLAVIALLLFVVNDIAAQTKWRFEDNIREFKKQDSISFPPKNGILFIGSSSIARWNDLVVRFAGYPIIRRGFGGAEYIEVLHYANDIITPYKPSHIFLYAGENDLARGKTTEEVYNIFLKLYKKLRLELPESKIYYISIKPSEKLKAFRPQIEKINHLIEELSANEIPHLQYVDIFHPMLDKNGNPNSLLFANDDLHLSEAGYDLWEKVLRKNVDIFISEKNKTETNISEVTVFTSKGERKPQFPLKTKRTLYTDAEIQKAQGNISRFPKAAEVKDNILRQADKWTEMDDADIIRLMPDARVPRAFDLNTTGCPVHGKEVFNKGGFYPWIIDPSRPFKVKCPIGGEIYPSNDFESYYRNGFKKEQLPDTKYVDDGWGWMAPNGERYWFVAYANHWMWYKELSPALLNLSRAYLLTGEKRYAHKAAVMLFRLAEVYPDMDYKDQSRYGLMVKKEGQTYNGKVVNHIWETGFIQNAAESYDNIWNSIDADVELQKLFKRKGNEIRSFIEANLLEEAVDAYSGGKIEGNYGMHQLALLYVLLTRQNMDIEKYVHLLVDDPGIDRSHTGLRYALFNQIFRDGQAFESPGYNLIWVERLTALSEMLKKTGIDLTKYKRLKMLLDSPLRMFAIGKYTVDLGDTGSPIGGVAGRDLNTYQIAFNEFKDSAYLDWMGSNNLTGGNSFATFESLFRNPLPDMRKLEGGRSLPPQPSRLFAGYGVGMLNNKKDKTAIALTYGMHVSHYHWDFLSFELFANSRKMMPDLGYPDAMNAYVPSIYSWSTNTISHNTVVVDSEKQRANLPGILHDFSESKFARIIDVSSDAYPQVTNYRRNLTMVDVDDDQSYVVDFFRISGGKRHTYSLHGSPGKVSVVKGNAERKRAGTFAGPDVDLGRFYDAPQYDKEDYKGTFTGYSGSGFQHLFNVQEMKDKNNIIEFAHILDSAARLRIHLMDFNSQKNYLADAYDKPRAKNYLIKYVLADREIDSGSRDLESTFISIFEPFSSQAYIKSSKLLNLDQGSGIALEVTREKEKDIIVNDTANSLKKLKEMSLETDANNAVLTLNDKGKLMRLFFNNGTFLKYKKKKYDIHHIKGIVKAVDYNKGEIEVELDDKNMKLTDQNRPSVVFFYNEYNRTVHPITSIYQNEKRIHIKVQDDLLVGIAKIDALADKTISTSTYLPFFLSYKGGTILNSQYEPVSKIAKISAGKIMMNKDKPGVLNPDEDIWITTVGIGDRVEIIPEFSFVR